MNTLYCPCGEFLAMWWVDGDTFTCEKCGTKVIAKGNSYDEDEE